MIVRLLNFHCIVDLDLLVENHAAYMSCINALEIREESPSLWLGEFD